MIPTPPASPAASPASGTDLERLQGAWKAIAGRRAARLRIIEMRFTFEFIGGEVYEGTIRLDASASPARMDMRIEEGPAAQKGQLAMCIYHVDGDVLRWCPTQPGAGYRLTRFPSVDDDHYYSLVFRRDGQPQAH
jgi:uncharacterized protein (TIGR03067 family)